uniref:Uncharacterized protein n=1 Tax=viral metagenome TaxID=1070528 RepID=A0A6C0DQA2_9ZZZZ
MLTLTAFFAEMEHIQITIRNTNSVSGDPWTGIIFANVTLVLKLNLPWKISKIIRTRE